MGPQTTTGKIIDLIREVRAAPPSNQTRLAATLLELAYLVWAFGTTLIEPEPEKGKQKSPAG
jgi:hypothetical protein